MVGNWEESSFMEVNFKASGRPEVIKVVLDGVDRSARSVEED